MQRPPFRGGRLLLGLSAFSAFRTIFARMIAPWLALLPLIVFLLLAAGWDVASYTIPNFIQIGLILAFAAFALATGISPGIAGNHVLAGLAGLAAGFTLFALGYIGGGDAKLFASIALWLGFGDLPAYALIACILGGGLSLLLLTARKFPLPHAFARYQWVLRLHDSKSGVPYGVALAAGLFLILPQTEVFRLAASHV